MVNVQRKKKRSRSSRTVIHVTVLSNRNRSQCSRSIIRTHTTSTLKLAHESVKTASSNDISIYHSQDNNKWANPTDYTGRRYQPLNIKKKNMMTRIFPRFCLIISLITVTISIVALIILLVLLSNNSKRKTTTKSITNVTLRWKPDAITVVGITRNASAAANQLDTPRHFIVDDLYNIYIADSRNHRIQKYIRGATNGTTIAGLSNGTWSPSIYGLSYPGHILLDSDQNLYITDTGMNRIKFWKKDASFGQVITSGGAYPFNLPYGTVRDPVTNTLYVADYGNHRVIAYTSNATSAVLVAGGNGPGCNTSQLHYPIGLRLNVFTNSLIIVNGACNNIICLNLDTNNRSVLVGSEQGISGNTPTLLHGPLYIKFDPMGNLYVSDLLNYRIQFFAYGQTTAVTIAGKTLKAGSNSTLLDASWAVELDNQLNLYVADTENHRIQKFLRY